MNEQEQRIAIAEACGWYDCHCHEGGNMPVGKPDDDWNKDVKSGLLDQQEHEEDLPNYLHDLNAMHDAESTLLFSRRQRYYEELKAVMSQKIQGTIADIECCRATAAQRAEAFLLAIGKWKPTVPATGNPITPEELDQKLA